MILATNEDIEKAVDEGRLNLDRPHQFKLNGSYNLAFGLTIGGFFQAKSGTPVSRILGVNSSAITYPEARLTDGRTDFFTQLDLFLQWGFQLNDGMRATLTANFLNVFDQDVGIRKANRLLFGASDVIRVPQDVYFQGYDYQAAIDAQGATRSPLFGLDNLFQAPRSVRLGIRLDF